MPDDIAIKVEHVSKTFRLPHEKNTSIKSAVVNFYKRKRSFEKQHVLNDISFEVKKGEFFGIVGRNGSGKSTLLKMLAGIYTPTKGNIQVNGKLTPFIELGVGFNMELTGRENVFLNGALLGFNRAEISAMYADIVEFAELERFMDQRLKNYSSGMQVRLAFSIAIRANSHILLLDEVLAVGDAIFQQKCFEYFKELKQKGETVVLVSHDSGALQKYCDKGILIEEGEIRTSGPIQTVLNEYQNILVALEESTSNSSETEQKSRWGNGIVTVEKAVTTNADGVAHSVFVDTDPVVQIKVSYTAHEDIESPIYGVIVTDSMGAQLFSSNTSWLELKVPNLHKGQTVQIIWKVPNIFNNGTYKVSPAVANNTGTIMFDWREAVLEFKVRKKLQSTALVSVEHDLKIIQSKS